MRCAFVLGLRMDQARDRGKAAVRAGRIDEAISILEPWLDAAVGGRKPKNDEIPYWLGVAYEKQGMVEQALRTFEQGSVVAGSEFAARCAAKYIDLAIDQGHWNQAERFLTDLLSRGSHATVDEFRAKLVRLYLTQARFDEARLVLLAGLIDKTISEPIAAIRNLWFLERGGAPIESIEESVTPANRNVPRAEQALARARLALLKGDGQGALELIDRAPIGAVFARRTKLDAARLARMPSLVCDQALDIWYHPGDESKIASTVAWLARTLGVPASVLEPWLEEFPDQPELIEAMAGLRDKSRDASAAVLRERKAKLDAALDRYGERMVAGERMEDPQSQVELAKLALAAGRLQEAGCWAELALQATSKHPMALEIAERAPISGKNSRRAFPGGVWPRRFEPMLRLSVSSSRRNRPTCTLTILPGAQACGSPTTTVSREGC